MDMNESKMEYFNTIVYKKVETRCKETLEELEDEQNAMREKRKNELLLETQASVRKKVAQATNSKNQEIAKAVDDNRKAILHRKEELRKDLMESVMESLKEFETTDQYMDYISRCSEVALPKMSSETVGVVINTLNNKDKMKKVEDIAAKYQKKIQWEASPVDIYGGIIFVDKALNFSLDYSFKTALEDMRYSIGKRLHFFIDEVGED